MNDISPGEGGAPRTDAAAADRLATLHRARFLRPLCAGRSVLDACRTRRQAEHGGDRAAGGCGRHRAARAGAERRRRPGAGARRADTGRVCSRPCRACATPCATAACWRWPAGRDLPTPAAAGQRAELEAALALALRHVASYRQRTLVGTLLADARFEASRVVALADSPASAPDVTVLLCSNTALPDLACGVFEAPAGAAAALAAAGRPRREAAVPPVAPVAGIANPLELPEESVRDEDLLDLRRRAVALVERLVERDEHACSIWRPKPRSSAAGWTRRRRRAAPADFSTCRAPAMTGRWPRTPAMPAAGARAL